MKIKMLNAVFTSPEPIKVDDIVKIDDARGAYWIAQGWAERVSDDLVARHEIVSENQWRTDAPPIGAVIECKWYHEEALRVCEVVQLPNDRPGRYLLYDQATGQHYDARCAEKWRVLNGHTHVIASATPNVQCTAHVRRPPIGVKPEHVWLSERIAALRDAVARYEAASVTVPEKWLHELSRHENTLALRKVTFTERVEI